MPPLRLTARHMRFRKLTFVVALTAVLQLGTKTLAAQDLGHKLPGLIGLDAGRVPEPGLYVVDRVVSYDADQLRDRNGNRIPTGPLRLTARANAAGLSYTFSLRPDSLFWSVAAAAPVARFSLNVHDRPEASVDRFGLSDIYILPVRMGWRRGRLDVVASYAVYLPTGTSPLAGGRGVSSGQITHQFALGGSVYAGKDKDFVLTALASYDLNRRKRDMISLAAMSSSSREAPVSSGSLACLKLERQDTDYGRFGMIAARTCPLRFAAPATARMGRARRSRCLSKRFGRRSAFAMNGTSLRGRAPKAPCSARELLSSSIVHGRRVRVNDGVLFRNSASSVGAVYDCPYFAESREYGRS